jgi:DNA replication licensing factor MCM4
VDSAKPGDRVVITGILRASTVRNNPRQRVAKSIYRTCTYSTVCQPSDSPPDIDVLHIQTTEAPEEKASKDAHFQQQQRERFEALASKPDIYEILTRSLGAHSGLLGIIHLIIADSTKHLGT